MKHVFYTPFTGLGHYSGHRGSRWLKNRIKIFKQFVVPSLQAQTSQEFMLWVSWRRADKGDKQITDLYNYLVDIFGERRVVFTYDGVCFWDDKYPDDEAYERLIKALHESLKHVTNFIDEDTVVMTIQPSDDCYHKGMVEEIRREIADTDAVGYTRGYIANYQTGEVREYNPQTNPPFFSIKFTKEDFIDPFLHLKRTGPYKSHEYVPDFLKYKKLNKRGFLVGTHSDNISTVFDHPYSGEGASHDTLEKFGIGSAGVLSVPFSFGRVILRKLPYQVRRKLRYWASEKKWIFRPIFAFIYWVLRTI